MNRYRFFILLVVISVIARAASCNRFKRDAEENDDHLLNILKDHEIIPDLIDDAPHADILEVTIDGITIENSWNHQFELQIGYGDDISVNRGDELTPTEVRDQPVSLKWSSDPTLFYTLLMIGSYFASISQSFIIFNGTHTESTHRSRRTESRCTEIAFMAALDCWQHPRR